MIYYRLLPLSLSSLLLGCQGMAQSPIQAPSQSNSSSPTAMPASAQLTLEATPQVRCPAGQACDNNPDYRALIWQSGGAEVFLSFSGNLSANDREPAKLNQHFKYADIYMPQSDGRVLAIHAAPDAKAEAQLHFLPSPAGRLHAQLLVKRHRLQSDGNSNDATCRTDDMQGVCRRETTINTPLTLDLNLAWPVQ